MSTIYSDGYGHIFERYLFVGYRLQIVIQLTCKLSCIPSFTTPCITSVFKLNFHALQTLCVPQNIDFCHRVPAVVCAIILNILHIVVVL